MLLPSDPHSHMELKQVLENVLGRKQQIVSYEGTSQYQAISGSMSIGTSACGLAAVNCARKLFQVYQNQGLDNNSCRGCGKESWNAEHDSDCCMLYRCLSRQTAQDIMSICSFWTVPTHLDVDEILGLPIFKHSLTLAALTYTQTNHKQFRKILQQLAAIEGVAAAVITRPPEILLCFKTSVFGENIYIVFDSHPRSSHPNGSGFTLNVTIEASATCLDELLSIDSAILSDPLLSWHAQTMGHCSAHILVPGADSDLPNIDEIQMETTSKMLELMAELSELRNREVQLMEINEDLSNQLKRLEISRLRKSTKGKGKVALANSRDRSLIPFGTNGITASPSSHILDPSEELARHLQAQFDAEDRKLATEIQILQQQNKTFTCDVCLETFQQDFVAQIKVCQHSFCRDCLRQHATTTIESRRYPVPCPTCVANSAKKPMDINDDLLETLGISDEIYAAFQEMQLIAHSITLHCRRCKETMFVDKLEYQSMKIITCPLHGCDHVWCKSCERSIDPSGGPHSCDGSSELKHLAKAHGWRSCPGCHTMIEKEIGCHHMTCISPGCNTHFCYVCGEMITQAVSRVEIKAAVGAHYRKCTLF